MAITNFPINTVAPTANIIISTPSGVITATNVQSAINQLAALVGGGGGSPGGSSGQVQVNSSGSFGGLTAAQLTALINQFSNSLKGLTPASGGGTTNFLRADGNWAAPAGGGGGALFTPTTDGAVPASGGGNTKFIRADGVWVVPPGGGGTITSLNLRNPKDFGALGDGSGSAITQSDWQANTQWAFVYNPGTTWDTVGLQEALIDAFGFAPSPAPANAIRVSCSTPTSGTAIANTTLLFSDYFNLQNIVNGNTTQASTQVRLGATIAGKFIRFDFRQGSVIITEAQWFQSNTGTNGVWQWQGSNDGSSWTNIGATFTLGGATTQTQTTLNANVTAYSSYRLFGISGTGQDTTVISCINFKQAGSYITSSRTHSVSWNSFSGFTGDNNEFFCPQGNYIVNRQIFTAAQNANINFQSRGRTLWTWAGDQRSAMWLCDSLSYTTVRNPSFQTHPDYGTNYFEPLWDIDGSGAFGLKTQFLTIYDPVFFGNGITDIPLAISRGGGTAQGDTTTIINIACSGFQIAGVSLNGGNVVGITFIGGAIGSFGVRAGILVNSGTFTTDGLLFTNQATGLNHAPANNQIIRFGADILIAGGSGADNISMLKACRSESEVLCDSAIGSVTVDTCGIASAGQFDTIRSYPWLIGTYIQPNTNNNRQRTFVVVGDSGDLEQYPNGWKLMGGASTGFSLVDGSGATYTVNQWAGFICYVRFGSNGFVVQTGVVSNTATTLTLDTDITGFAAPDTLYHITGLSHPSVEPNWDLAPSGNVFYQALGSGQGFFTVAGSNVITTTIGIGTIINGDFIIIPEMYQMGVSGQGPTERTGYIGRVVSGGGTGTLTMDKKTYFTRDEMSGFYGTAQADGQMFLLEVPFATARNCAAVSNSKFGLGKLENCRRISNTELPLAQNSDANIFSSGAVATADTVFDVINNKQFLQNYDLDTVSGAFGLSAAFAISDGIQCVPVGNTTFNAPSVTPSSLKRRITFQITTSGTTSFVITFGTNFRSTGTITTGATNNKIFTIVFESSGNSWVEISRSGPL